ncbi:MAG: caspase family protein, partial [Thermoguttaceae bacterium]|nr:caspase family protein [Thermoguttaceae bacterium]
SPGAGERKAFLVAADDYGVKASALPGAKRDVEALRARLLKIGFEERNVVTLQTARTDDGEIDFDLLPQKAKIEERFKAFVDDLQPGDFAFVFLSGHGLEAPRTNEAFFVPIDFDPDKPLATSVSVDAMMAALAKSAAKFRWFAVDACRSRPSAPSRTLFASKSTDASPLSEIANVPASVVLLQSCRSGQSSYEGGFGKAKDISNGFFALSLLEALDPKESKADENKDGAASFLEICRYATTRTNALAQTYYKRKQEPTLSGADITDFPFLTGLLVDGLPYDEWKRANDAFEAAKASRLKGEYEAALDKLALALQIAPENEACRAEETELRQLVAATKPSDGETSPTLTPEQAKARYLEGRRMAWGLDGTNVYGLRAFEALKEAAENGCAEAAGELARFYVWGGEGTDVDYERAKSWAEKGAESGDPTAQFILAWIYYLGRGVEPDDEKAEAFGRAAFEGFRRLAESGDVVATYWLGKCCYMGIGVEKNDADAARYYREASEANLPAATRAWGEHRLYGIGVEKDEADGANLLCAAADRGDASAMCALGMCYRLGVGVDKDDEEAYERYRQAAERSEPTG